MIDPATLTATGNLLGGVGKMFGQSAPAVSQTGPTSVVVGGMNVPDYPFSIAQPQFKAGPISATVKAPETTTEKIVMGVIVAIVTGIAIKVLRK